MNAAPEGSLHLLQCYPDVRQLALWGHRNGLLRTAQETGFQKDDPGYVLHALLRAAFGDLAPKPFWYRVGGEGLLAFTRHDPDVLRKNACLATPDVSAALGLNGSGQDLGLASRKFPDRWSQGQILCFEARVRPVVRTKATSKHPGGTERDAFLAYLDRKAEDEKSNVTALRETIYAEWLSRQFGKDGGAKLESAQIAQYRLTSVLRQQGLKEDGRRARTMVSGPEVVMSGTLMVDNTEAFSEMLARGIGRHRAFGFGMVLLRPAR